MNYKRETLDTDTRICFYEQEFYPFSNFSSFQLNWRGHTFQTSEAAYHYEKFIGGDHAYLAIDIQRARSAHDAYKIAQRHKDKRRSDWDEVKVSLMKDILVQKVLQHPYVLKKLLDSGNRKLVENSWRDGYWGIGPDGKGLNMLGVLWMEVRDMFNVKAQML